MPTKITLGEPSIVIIDHTRKTARVIRPVNTINQIKDKN